MRLDDHLFYQIYEKVAKDFLQNKLTAPSAKDLLFRANLLHLLTHVVLFHVYDTIDQGPTGASNMLSVYNDWDPTYANTREGKLVKKLINCYENCDEEGFTEAWQKDLYK